MSSKLGWVVQTNLGKDSDVEAIRETCAQEGYDFFPVVHVPFTNTLPDVPTDQPLLFYGSCNFIERVEKSAKWQVFQYSDAFDVSYYTNKYAGLSINQGTLSIPLAHVDVLFRELDSEELFIKPTYKGKAFAGKVVNREELAEMVREVEDGSFRGDYPFDTTFMVSAARPRSIDVEYRMFMVDGVAVSCSSYKARGQVRLETCWDRRVFEYCELCDRVYRPCDIYALDVCTSEGKLWVVEINDFSSSGFYLHDIAQVVRAASRHRLKQWEEHSKVYGVD